MSLVTQIAALATRVAEEFNSVRSQIAGIPAGTFPAGDSFPVAPTLGQTFFETTEKVAYIYGGEFWIPLNVGYVTDGGDAEAQAVHIVDGGDAEPSASANLDGGDA
jgi:hypothetical protein